MQGKKELGWRRERGGGGGGTTYPFGEGFLKI